MRVGCHLTAVADIANYHSQKFGSEDSHVTVVGQSDSVAAEPSTSDKGSATPVADSKVSELEKQLEPIRQNLSDVKVDLDFDKDDELSEQTSERAEPDNVAERNEDKREKTERVTAGTDSRKRKSLDDKLERYKKFLKQDMKKRQGVISQFEPESGKDGRNEGLCHDG